MSFNADKKREHESAAESALADKDYAKAFFHTAKAAEFGLKLAEQSAGKIARRYVEDAYELIDIADQLQTKARTQDQKSLARVLKETAGTADGKAEMAWQLQEKPTEKLADVAGLSDVKEALQEKVILPFQKPEVYQRFKARSGAGVLMYGPPGNGKTFVAKAIGVPIAKFAARVMVGQKLADLVRDAKQKPSKSLAVKTPVFPFARFPGVDIVLGPEMRSTWEVMGLDQDFGRAFAKAQMGAGVKLPLKGTCFMSVKDRDKAAAIPLARRLVHLGFHIVATGGTASALQEAGLPVKRINKVFEGQPHGVDALINGDIQLMINTTTTSGKQILADSFSLRRTALMQNIPHYTTMPGARAVVEAIAALQTGTLDVMSLQDYLKG